MAVFSILIPVYNTEEYVEECLESIKNQTFGDYEVIMVDDGSTDGSGQICNQFEKMDSRFKLIYQENQGPLVARLTAFFQAKGDFIIYLDSDDYWEVTLLENVYEAIIRFNCDVVLFRWKYVNNHRIILGYDEPRYEKEQLFNNINTIIECLLSTEYENSLCKKAIRRRCVNKLRLEDLYELKDVYFGEDMAQAFVMLYSCKNGIYLDKILYNYRKNDKSISSDFTPKLLLDVCTARQYILKSLNVDMQKRFVFMLEKCFLEQYLAGLVSISTKCSIVSTKELASSIKRMDIYQQAIVLVDKSCLTYKKKVLFFMERHNLWVLYKVVSYMFRCIRGEMTNALFK